MNATTLRRIETELRKNGIASAWISSPDSMGRPVTRNAKIFSIEDGWMSCKEYSGSEFQIHIDSITEIA